MFTTVTKFDKHSFLTIILDNLSEIIDLSNISTMIVSYGKGWNKCEKRFNVFLIVHILRNNHTFL